LEDSVSKAKTAKDMGLGEAWKVRVHMRGSGMIHVLSRTEPEVELGVTGLVGQLCWEPIVDTAHGDTIGYINWDEVSAVTWRRA